MHVQDLLTWTFQLGGEPNDLCPFLTPGDPTTFDTGLTLATTDALLHRINAAVLRIARWKYGDGTHLRFKHLSARKFFKTKGKLSGAVQTASADTVEILTGFGSNQAGQFDGWMIEVVEPITGNVQRDYVIETTGVGAAPSVCRIRGSWTTIPDSTYTFNLIQREFTMHDSSVSGDIYDYGIVLSAANDMSDFIRVKDLTSAVDLSPAPSIEDFTATMLTKSIPTMYKQTSVGLVFDSFWDVPRAYELRYYAEPTPLTAVDGSQHLDIPEAFHEAVMLWAAHTIMMRSQDFNGAYATKRDLQEMMQTLRGNGEMDLVMETAGFYVPGG